MRDLSKSIGEALISALARSIEVNGNSALLYSGGLDSSIIAGISSSRGRINLYTVGTEGSRDILEARKGASELGLELTEVIASDEDVLISCHRLNDIFAKRLGRRPTRLELSIYSPMVFALENVSEKVVLSGQGADEEFGGYSRYLRMDRSVLAEALNKDLDDLLLNGIRRDASIASEFGKTLVTPFLSTAVVSMAREMPLELKIDGGTNKVILRAVAAMLGLSAASAHKKAMQYGSGFEKAIKRLEHQSVLWYST